jgi:hypothetical protein
MTEQEHTPGPWRVGEFTSAGKLEIIDPFGGLIARLSEEDEGDARLIASAPALLDALIAIRDCITATEERDADEMREIAREAIRLATEGDKS